MDSSGASVSVVGLVVPGRVAVLRPPPAADPGQLRQSDVASTRVGRRRGRAAPPAGRPPVLRAVPRRARLRGVADRERPGHGARRPQPRQVGRRRLRRREAQRSTDGRCPNSVPPFREYTARSDITESMVTIQSPFCGYNTT